MSTKSLWGQLPATEGIRTPTQVFREQAIALTDVTSSVLQGDVSVTRNQGTFSIELHIVAPVLDNYHYLVVRATHDVALYPVTIVPGWDLFNDGVLCWPAEVGGGLIARGVGLVVNPPNACGFTCGQLRELRSPVHPRLPGETIRQYGWAI
jgi:hypothetical protein